MRKIGLFIDYANLWASYKKLGKMLDFRELYNFLELEFWWKLYIKYIYFAYPEVWTRNYNVWGIHKFAVFLEKELWFNIVKKPLKLIEVRDSKWKILLDSDNKPTIIEKGNLDIELSMDVMQTWQSFDDMILFSWDSDFKCINDFLLKNNKNVYVFSTIWNISSELMKHSTKYYDFIDLPDNVFISKLKHRSQKIKSPNIS